MKILFHSNFGKKYSKLSQKIKNNCDERISLFEKTPDDSVLRTHRLHGKLNGYFSINISGDLWAVFRFIGIDTIQFVDIDNHNNLYN